MKQRSIQFARRARLVGAAAVGALVVPVAMSSVAFAAPDQPSGSSVAAPASSGTITPAGSRWSITPSRTITNAGSRWSITPTRTVTTAGSRWSITPTRTITNAGSRWSITPTRTVTTAGGAHSVGWSGSLPI